MKSCTISEIRKELNTLPPKKLLAVCLRLAKYKKENKELLSYLLFEADDEKAFIEKVKLFIDEQFLGINKTNLYYTQKNLRKILRTTNKYIKYSGLKETETELLIYFSKKLQTSGIPFHRSTSLHNLYHRQIQKIGKAISLLHEDLQYDFNEELKQL